jgi:hypothetical protein
MENSEKSDAIKAGQARARADDKHMGRPKAVFDRAEVVRLRDENGRSWPEIPGDLVPEWRPLLKPIGNSRI